MFSFASEIHAETVREGVVVKQLGTGQNMNTLHWDLAPGSVVPPHSHEQEQFGYIIKGSLEVTIGDRRAVLRPGDSYIIPPHVEHGFITLEESEAIDIFSPVRSGVFQPK